MMIKRYKAIAFSVLTLFLSLSSAMADPQANDARVKAALKLLDLGNAQEAQTQMQQLVQQEPKNAEAHAALALADVDLGDINAAQAEAQTAFDLDRKIVLVR